MIRQPENVGGDGGFSIPASKLPSWLTSWSSSFTIAFWYYRERPEASGDTGYREPFSLGAPGSSDNFFAMRVSGAVIDAKLREGGNTYEWDRADGLNSVAPSPLNRWCLVVATFDVSGTNLVSNIYHLDELNNNENDNTSHLSLADTLAVADLPTLSHMNFGRTRGWMGSNLWRGVLGGLVAWKDTLLTAADAKTLFDSRNPQPWNNESPSGNIPAIDYDGQFIVPLCPGGNCKERGTSTYTTGPVHGDTVDSNQDVLVYRRETGVSDSGNIAVYENSIAFPASPAGDFSFFNAFRENV